MQPQVQRSSTFFPVYQGKDHILPLNFLPNFDCIDKKKTHLKDQKNKIKKDKKKAYTTILILKLDF